MAALLKPVFGVPEPKVRISELTIDAGYGDSTVGEVAAKFPDDVKIIAVRLKTITNTLSCSLR